MKKTFVEKLEENKRRCLLIIKTLEGKDVDSFQLMVLKREMMEEFVLLKRAAKRLERKKIVSVKTG